MLAGGVELLAAAVGDGAVLVVDDLQWADPSSLTFLASALARLPRLAAVLAFRPDEPAFDSARVGGVADPAATAALAAVRATRTVVDVTVGALPDAALAALVGDPRLAAVLRTETDRTPFALAEVLRELAVRGAAAAGPDGRWQPRDATAVALAIEVGRQGQRRAVRRRAERETGVRAQVLALVALLARETTARVVATAAGLDPREALDALSGLATAGLLRLGEQGWATAHDLVGETVTAALAPGERGRLHGLLAAALEAADADPAEVARHHRDAGDGTAAAAAFERAAHRALAEHATREAAAHAEAGLALQTRSGLLEVRAEARAAHGDVAGALADLQAAGGTGPARSRRMSRSAMLTMGAHDPARAAELAELALVEAGADAAARAVALETAAVLDVNLGRPGRAAERADAALALFRGLGDGAGVARILDGRAMAAFLDGRITEAVGLFGRIAALFEDSGDLLRVVTPRSTRGHGLVFHAEPEAGLAETSAATAARDRSRDARGAGLRAVAPVGGPLGTRPAPRGRGRRTGGAARRPGGRAPRLDRDRVAGARHRPAGPGTARRRRCRVRRVRADGGGDADAVRLVGGCPVRVGRGGARAARRRRAGRAARPGDRAAAGALRGAMGAGRAGRGPRDGRLRRAGRGSLAPGRCGRAPGVGAASGGAGGSVVTRPPGMAYAPTRGGGVSRGPVLTSGSPPGPSQSPASAHRDGLIGYEG